MNTPEDNIKEKIGNACLAVSEALAAINTGRPKGKSRQSYNEQWDQAEELLRAAEKVLGVIMVTKVNQN